MKNLFLSFVFFILSVRSAAPHGIGAELYTTEHDPALARDQQSSPSGKSLTESLAERDRWWGTTLTTGWTSREMHYGVDETGNYGAYTTELAFRIERLTLSVWSGFGTGNDYQEWDFTVAYTFETKVFFFTPGYNFRYQPGVVEHGHSESASHDDGAQEEHEHLDHQEAHHEHTFQDTGHSHGTYGNELFFVLGTKAIPHVTPSLLFVCDLNNTPGSYLQIRVDGELPLLRGIFVLEPYALLGLNLGYNTTAYYGWNHFQFGLKASWQISRFVSVYGGISYSTAMTALQQIDQGNEVWASAGVTFSY